MIIEWTEGRALFSREATAEELTILAAAGVEEAVAALAELGGIAVPVDPEPEPEPEEDEDEDEDGEEEEEEPEPHKPPAKTSQTNRRR